MKVLNMIFLLTITLTLASCKKNEAATPPTKFLGTWETSAKNTSETFISLEVVAQDKIRFAKAPTQTALEKHAETLTLKESDDQSLTLTDAEEDTLYTFFFEREDTKNLTYFSAVNTTKHPNTDGVSAPFHYQKVALAETSQ